MNETDTSRDPAAIEQVLQIIVKQAGRDGTSVLCSAGDADVVAEARALNPKGVDVLPVTLKEIFLETVGVEN